MLFLIASFLLNVGIYSLFHLFPKYRIDTFQAIVFNYLTCVLTGLVFIGSLETALISEIKPWTYIAFFLGGIFIGTFYLMALTTQRYGISVASIASKMSLAIPVIFTLFIFDIESKEFNVWNYLGLFFAFFAISFSAFRPEEVEKGETLRGLSWILLPASVFLFGGIIDTTINYTNYRFLTPADAPVFPVYIFASASLVGTLALIFSRKKIRIVNIIGGLLLGIINYFSVYFLILALSAFQNDGAIVYPLLNILIIMGSALSSVILFGERLKPINKLGLILSLIAIFLISHQEIINFIGR